MKLLRPIEALLHGEDLPQNNSGVVVVTGNHTITSNLENFNF